MMSIPYNNFTSRVSRDKVVIAVKLQGPDEAFLLGLGVLVANLLSLENAVTRL